MTKRDRRVLISGLIETREYIKKGWTQGWFARDAQGEKCGETAKQAVCWCISGALCKVQRGKAWQLAMTQLEDTVKVDNIVEWNDTKGRTQSEVVSAITRTIKRLRAQEARQ